MRVANSGRLKQILLNLLSNAIKFSNEGGRVHVSANLKGVAVRIEVADTGVRITPEHQKRLFVEFKKLSGFHHAHRDGGGGNRDAAPGRYRVMIRGRLNWWVSTILTRVGNSSMFHDVTY